jgi:hypothetical protein
MLRQDELMSLSRALRQERVLSVYLNGSMSDPATKRAWRVELDRSLKDLRSWLAGSEHGEREAFERCVEALEMELSRFEGAIGAPGWVAFITGGRVADAEPLPTPMPTVATWSTGPCIAPYMRALKQTRTVVVLVGDARHVAIHRYRRGVLEHVDTIRAHVRVPEPLHMGDAPRAGFHAGVRGETGRDQTQRVHLAGTKRMISRVAARAVELAGSDGWIIIGGIPEVSAQLERATRGLALDRVLAIDSLEVHAGDAEIVAAAQRGASALRDASDSRQIARIFESADRNGVVALGPAATREALDQARVRELYITERYLDDHLADAESLVRSAVDQGATVQQVARDAAHLLDEHGGTAARLRFRLETGASSGEEVETGSAPRSG